MMSYGTSSPVRASYITIDVDGLDPSCAPGTVWPAPGGLWFWQAAKLVGELSRRCRLAGLDVSEFAPALDPLAHTATAITRLIMIAMGSTPLLPCRARDTE